MQGFRAGVLAAGLSLAAAAAPVGPGQSGLTELVKRFETPHIDPASVAITNLQARSGHLSVLMKSGNASLVRAGDEVVGFFFHGNGALEYRSEDPIEFPLMVYNARKASSLSVEKSEKALTIRDGFTDVLWLSSGGPLPDLPGTVGGPSLASFFEQHQEKFRHVRHIPPSHVLALERINAPSTPLRIVDFEGGKEDLRYVFDAWESRSENLVVLRKSTSTDPEVKKNYYLSVLSEQPIGRDRRDPLHPRFFLTDVRLEVVASDGKDVAVSVAETIVPQQEKQTVFRFELFNTTYDLIGHGALQPRSFRVREVTDESGQPLAFHHENADLLVALPKPAEPDRPVKLRFKIEGDFLIRPGGDDFWLLGIEPWFPQPDLGGQFYTLHAVVKVPQPFVPFAPGKTISRRAGGTLNILETEIDKPIGGAILLAGKYDFHEETRSGVTIRVATYAFKNPRAVKQLTDLAALVIDYYQTFLGPFPFSEFNILEINDYGFGQAPPAVMFITKEAFNPLMGEANQLFSGGVNERFAHEIAHQYWGHVVKMPSFEEQWLEEAFAEYSAALFMKQFKGKAAYNGLVAHWKGRASYATDKAPIPLANLVSVPGEPAVLFAVRTGLIYDKGAYLLASLHRQLGDDAFFTFLKSYQKSFQWKFGSTKTVAALLQFMTKKDFTPFFEANYWGTGMPTD
jgi:hypothetical protein